MSSTEVSVHVSTAVQQAQQFFDIIRRATTDEKFDPAKMQLVLEMNERIQDRGAKAAFNSAFTLMQEEMPVITRDGEIKVSAKDGRAARVQGKYAKFETINEVVRPVLAKYGFAVSFRTKVMGQQVCVIGTLRHQDGHVEESEIVLPADTSGGKNSVQAFGSTVSYGKRYMMTALLNITTEGEDDDGAAGGNTITVDTETGEVLNATRRTRPQSTGQPGMVTTGQLGVLHSKLDQKGVSAEALCKHFGIDALTLLPAAKVNDALAFIENGASA